MQDAFTSSKLISNLANNLRAKSVAAAQHVIAFANDSEINEHDAA